MIELLIEVLQGIDSGDGMNATLIAAATAVWGYMKRREVVRTQRSFQREQAFRILEAAVNATRDEYTNYVKADGKKLNELERKHAREIALAKGIVTAANEGIDLIGEIGRDFVDAEIRKMVVSFQKNKEETFI